MTRRAIPLALIAGALTPAPAAHAATWRATWCTDPRCEARADVATQRARHHRALHSPRQRKLRVIAPYRSFFMRVAQCESGGRWHIATGNGFWGGLQFTLSSWQAVGGVGYPHQATRLEQIYRAVLLLRVQGPGAWPVCSR